MQESVWIIGATRTGKTARLVEYFQQWIETNKSQVSTKAAPAEKLVSPTLVFATNQDNRRELADKLSIAVQGSYPVVCKTPLGFISDEVKLFWPLLLEKLPVKARFPLRLRPETEQYLATALWRSELSEEELQFWGGEYHFVRRTLDLLQLAGASCVPTEDIAKILVRGFESQEGQNSPSWEHLGELLWLWRQWCLERGLLTYGIIYELYWRYLLPDNTYREHLTGRYPAVFGDDLDDYPPISRELIEILLDHGAVGIFTYNPDGQVRLGLGSDPLCMEGLASRCRIENLTLSPRAKNGLAGELAEVVVELVRSPTFMARLPNSIQSIRTISRAELLRQTAEFIVQAVKSEEVKPEEIAIIAPGLDEIARYSLIEIISKQGIAIAPLKEQRPLISSPLIRALLNLLGLVYPGLGRLVERDGVAEMLVVLSQKFDAKRFEPEIDPVRAGLLADYCYHIDPEKPYLLPPETFKRWDRLGYKAMTAYEEIRGWIEERKGQLEHQPYPNPIFLLDLAIKRFFNNSVNLNYEQLSVLRELMETAGHFWEVDRRVRQNEAIRENQSSAISQFILLLRRGTITANPLPISYLGGNSRSITLANIFQYRSLRSSHRWQFWLDAASNVWDKGGAATLFAAPLFLQQYREKQWKPEYDFEMDEQRLIRNLRDLLGRAEERIYLCHSDLGSSGIEQSGPLLSLVYSSFELKMGVKTFVASKDIRAARGLICAFE
jgi:hypothetical protein